MREEYRQKAVEEGIPTTRLTPHGPAKARSSMARSEATARQSRQTQVDRARSRGGRRSRIDWRRSAEESALKLEFMGERIREGGDGGEASGQESGAKRSVFSCSSSLQQHAIGLGEVAEIGSNVQRSLDHDRVKEISSDCLEFGLFVGLCGWIGTQFT